MENTMERRKNTGGSRAGTGKILRCLLAASLSAAMLLPCSGGIFAQSDLLSGSIGDESASEPTGGSLINSVRVSEDRSSVSVAVTLAGGDAELYNGKKLYLFRLYSYQLTENLDAFDPVGSAVISGTVYSFSDPLDRSSGQMYARYLCAVLDESGSYTVLTGEKYIENYGDAALYSYSYPEPVSKKGLCFRNVADAELLGASNTVLNVAINEYFTVADDGSIQFDSCGTTYYINPEKLSVLDHKIKTLSEAGINIYLDILLTAPGKDQPDELDCLYSSEYATAVSYYAVNSEDGTATGYFRALLSFLAQRYTDPAGENGFAGSFIIGYEINSNRYYNNMGETELSAYVQSYIRLLRAADIAVRSVYSDARLYVSLSNNFNEQAVNKRVAVNKRLDYSAKSILDIMGVEASDIPWNIAFNVYASDYSINEIWNDDGAQDGFSTPYITMSNIGLICEYLAQSEMLCGGKMRSVAITEFGVSAEPEDAAALEKQAASFAYGYYKAAALDGIESVIYYRQVDSRLENEVFFGLRRYGETEDEAIGDEKPVYNVFRYIDTSLSADATASYLATTGFSGWDALIPGFDVNNYISRSVTEAGAVSADEIPYSYGRYSLFDFTDGDLRGFRPTENASFIDIREAAGLVNRDGSVRRASTLYANLVSPGSYEYLGISRDFPSGLMLSGIDYISLDIKPETSSSGTLKVMFRLFSRGDDGAGYEVYEGTADVAPGDWSTVCFDLSDLTGKRIRFDHMSVWIMDSDGNKTGENYAFWLSGISVYKKDISRVTRVVLIIVLAASVVLAAVCLLAVMRIISARRRRRQAARREEDRIAARRFAEQTERRSRELRDYAFEVAAEQEKSRPSGQTALKNRIEKTKRAGDPGNMNKNQ